MIFVSRMNRTAAIGLFVLVCVVLYGIQPLRETWNRPPKTPASTTLKSQPPSEQRNSKLHYLIPTTKLTAAVCASAASALLNRYSIPVLVGYKGEGEYDAKAAHIAKLRSVSRYLHNGTSLQDDDLVIVVDGFDVVAQNPAEATISMYFELMAVANQRVADKHGLSLSEARKKGLYETILWGTDKGCFPGPGTEPQCWLIPDSPSPHNVWGPQTNNGGLPFSPSKYLNSGTVIGPVGDLRRFIDKTLELITETWNPEYRYRNSDQHYVSKMYARQEYHRNLPLLAPGQEYPRKGDDYQLPKDRVDENDQTEFHVTVDFESAFTQTQCHNDIFMHKIKYDRWDNSALMAKDVMNEGEHFQAFKIPLPASFLKSWLHFFDAFDQDSKPAESAKTWFRSLALGTNIATHRIFAFYHNTCSKKKFVKRFQSFWYFPYLDPLLKHAAKQNLARKPISSEPIDDRWWFDALQLPTQDPNLGDEGPNPDGYGGLFTDLDTESYLSFKAACGEFYGEIFKVEPPTEERPRNSSS
ncbi:hypothetical protein BGZ63DRAFT_409401 [Mariannaea sp. PMI_226]|nr:hypothetical protein BGZ63DRAFT_409401 [Mariannaea sp. PMI_226]